MSRTKALIGVLVLFLLLDGLFFFAYRRLQQKHSSSLIPDISKQPISYFTSMKGEPLPLGHFDVSAGETSMLVIGQLKKVWRKGNEVRARIFLGEWGETEVLLAKSKPKVSFVLQTQDVPHLFPTSDHFRLRKITAENAVSELQRYQGKVVIFSLWLAVVGKPSAGISPARIALIKKLVGCNQRLADSLRFHCPKPHCLSHVSKISVYENNEK